MNDFVENVGNRTVTVVAITPGAVRAIESLGGLPRVGALAHTWRIDYDTEDDLAKILQRLRDVDIAFAGGHGWPPAEVAAWLRDEGKLHGAIKVLTWSGPGKENIQEY